MIFETKKQLQEQINDAELRAGKHFSDLYKIRNIIINGEREKRLYVDMIKDIKRVLANDWQSNN